MARPTLYSATNYYKELCALALKYKRMSDVEKCNCYGRHAYVLMNIVGVHHMNTGFMAAFGQDVAAKAVQKTPEAVPATVAKPADVVSAPVEAPKKKRVRRTKAQLIAAGVIKA